MVEREVSTGVLFHPEGQGRWPGVIHLTDIGGIRQAHRQMAGKLAEQGFLVYMPQLFYRNAEPPVMNVPRDAPREKLMQRVGELTAPLTPDAVEADSVAYVEFLSSQELVQRNKPIGVVGHCFSGAFAMRLAATCADQVAACASFHGGGLYTDAPDSPHLLLPKISARLYFGHAVKDPFMPESAIEGLNRALAEWGGVYESEVYEGAYHSWTSPDSPVYNRAQADRAFAKLVELLRAAI